MMDLYRLCEDFKKPRSETQQKSKKIISKIYRTLVDSSPKTRMILEAWKENFQYIYGDVATNLSSNRKLDTQEILSRYDIAGNSAASGAATQLLFFSIQTYFSLLIKCIMSDILGEKRESDRSPQDLVLGLFARRHRIKNYSNPDWYCWPVFELDNGFEEILSEICFDIKCYRTDKLLTDFAENNNYDFIKQLYEAIIPKELRHALGEYYTPDWLAEETLEQAIQLSGNKENLRFIDPTCGSGTFLIKAILEKRKKGYSLNTILETAAGMDINPLAVLTAKTNYLLSIIDLLDDDKNIEIPIYNTDILRLDKIEPARCEEDFLQCENPVKVILSHMEIGRERARNLRNADVIVGNPPWVNWEYLPEKYRKETQHLWLDYKLFAAIGRDLCFSKEDISVLITYVVIDRLLKNGGLLAFVIRQGVFKSAQNGAGFRRFRIKEEQSVKVLRVDDLSRIRAFDNAVTFAALLYMRKGSDTEYPLPYILWQKRNNVKNLSFNAYSELREVKSQIAQISQKAMPAVAEDITSVWMTASEDTLPKIRNVLGKNNYRARTGVFTGGANAVYWMTINSSGDSFVQVTNVVERAKRKTDQITAAIEKEHLYPMLRGSNLKRWQVSYDTYLLCPHTVDTKMQPVSQEVLKSSCPGTYEYLSHFREELNERKGFSVWEKEIQKQEFHAILRVGAYTFSKYKVVWKYIASEFVCAVISTVDDPFLGNKLLIPNEKVMYLSTDNEMEAYYLCGVLSSTLVADCIKSYMNPTSISAHILNKLNIPEYDKGNPLHSTIANSCRDGHMLGHAEKYIKQIDDVIEDLFSRR